MSVAVVLFVIAVLGTASGERCNGYTDIFGDYHAGFRCPTSSDFSSETYCCGIASNPYCCSSCLLSQFTFSCDADDIGDIVYLGTGAIVGIALGSLAFIGIIITVCCCCCCACCAGCRSNPPPTTTVITNQPAAGVTVAQTSYQPYPQYPPSREMAQYPPPGPQYPPPGAQYPPQGQQGGMVYPPPYPGQGGQPMKH
ncbi:SHISA4 [Branchiostoma lanceolatum]|uniref:SHISA4 protein n=1 Tax=Branchiostoma lanceolatum TaxID=7740 RepID=A0A8K0ETL1_BRALA|nr:SHISA4 [Branchiostoma lanceolatum]